MHVENVDNGWLVTAPPHRFDIEYEVDLIEEVARIHGYDSIPETTLVTGSPLETVTETRIELERVAATLIARDYQDRITSYNVCYTKLLRTIASVIERTQRPAIILAPNKTLAAQLYGEMREFFPNNAVEYFVSYYDYYQPEAYVPASDTYIEKDASINQHIEQT